MKPPVPWKDGGADAPVGATELLRSAAPPPAFTDELRSRLGAGVAQTAALAQAVGWSSLVVKGLVVVSIGGASGLGAHYFARAAAPLPPPPSVSAPVVPLPTPTPVLLPKPAPPAVQLSLPVPTPEPPRLKLDPRLEEAELLEKARALLASNPAAALRLTAEHGRKFAKGRLGPEAELIAAQSLLALGNVPAAKARAKASLERNPRGLYASQLRDIAER